ncbi:rho guanine nucleotide exchange factor 1b isoform X8 [Labeo rohita]|uniref:rho guanine nucleotide exchange factor 1b isoform X8 n=1 Tax=Labeo rohita TaxID=84645 RepID=UPI0021E1DCD6|nr:rho guanine nucleotide exchange factor 1b isoform X8 [Labeo rohita]
MSSHISATSPVLSCPVLSCSFVSSLFLSCFFTLLSCPVLLFPFHSCLVLYFLVLSYPFIFVLFSFIVLSSPFIPFLSYLVLSFSSCSCLVLSFPFLSFPFLSCFYLFLFLFLLICFPFLFFFYSFFTTPFLFYLVLSFLSLSCLSYPVLSCLFLSFPFFPILSFPSFPFFFSSSHYFPFHILPISFPFLSFPFSLSFFSLSIASSSFSFPFPYLLSFLTTPFLSCLFLFVPVFSFPLLSFPFLFCPVLSFPFLFCPVLSFPSFPFFFSSSDHFPFLILPISSTFISSSSSLSVPILPLFFNSSFFSYSAFALPVSFPPHFSWVFRNVRRSESLCVERRHSRRSGSTRAKQSRSRSDVDLQSTSTSHPLSPSPQHSVSAEGGLLTDGLSTGPAFGPFPQQEEMEPRLLELEQDPPNWRVLASSEELNKLSKKEIKRQEIINELFATEHAHVRMLSVLQTVFSRPLEREEIMTVTELATIFPSLDEIIEMHYAFYENLKRLRQEDEYIVKIISTPLLNRFSGSEGEWFQKLTARFCSYQSWALEQIKSRQKKDPRFNAFILEAESKPQCRRLQLKDIIPIEMQRLTKYPLLLENIAKNTDDAVEKENINQAAESCRKILNHVNEEVKLMENLLILKDYQRRLDTSGLKPSNDLYSEYKNIDLTTRKMLFEGPLTWRVTKEKAIDVHCVLLSDLLVLFQKQDDKMVLKCQSKSNIAAQEGKQMLSPVIKLESVFLRDVATDPKALYVIFTWDSGAQIYELVAQSGGEKKNWTEVIKTTVDELKKRGGNKPQREKGSIHGSIPGTAYSPVHPPLSPTENGGDLLKRSGRFKDSLTDEKSRDSDSLIDFLAANGFDLLSHSHTPPEKFATDALDEVMYLKRLFVGSISLSDDSQTLGENGGTAPERQEADGGQSSVEESSTEGGTEGEQTGGDGGSKGEEESGISAPLVLSQERLEEVQRRLQSIEEQLKRLQAMEEDHHKLQEALAKYSLQGGHYN